MLILLSMCSSEKVKEANPGVVRGQTAFSFSQSRTMSQIQSRILCAVIKVCTTMELQLMVSSFQLEAGCNLYFEDSLHCLYSDSRYFIHRWGSGSRIARLKNLLNTRYPPSFNPTGKNNRCVEIGHIRRYVQRKSMGCDVTGC